MKIDWLKTEYIAYYLYPQRIPVFTLGFGAPIDYVSGLPEFKEYFIWPEGYMPNKEDFIAVRLMYQDEIAKFSAANLGYDIKMIIKNYEVKYVSHGEI